MFASAVRLLLGTPPPGPVAGVCFGPGAFAVTAVSAVSFLSFMSLMPLRRMPIRSAGVCPFVRTSAAGLRTIGEMSLDMFRSDDAGMCVEYAGKVTMIRYVSYVPAVRTFERKRDRQTGFDTLLTITIVLDGILQSPKST